MTKEAQRIAIAKACPDLFVIGQSVFGLPHLYWKQDGKFQGASVDPLSDLNAMHEAENWLLEQDSDAFERYTKTLCYIVDLEGGYYVCATAPQRLQAMLKTLNLWTDDACRAQESE